MSDTVRVTPSSVILGVSESAYREIRGKLRAAGYRDGFHFQDGLEQIDMSGLVLRRESASETAAAERRAGGLT